MGQDEYQLRTLKDEQLLAGLAGVGKRRNQVTAEFLAYLAELDERRLYLDLGFASLFEYCVQALRLCESTAGRHIAAARVCRAHPQVFTPSGVAKRVAWVASGELHASALSLLKKHLTSENASELFERCRKQTARQVEELLAARFPKPDVRDLVRRLPVQVGVTLDVERAPEHNGHCLQEKTEATSGRPGSLLGSGVPTQCAKAGKQSTEFGPTEHVETPRSAAPPSLAPRPPEPAKSRRIEPLSADRYGVHFTADGEFCQLLERVRGLAGHRLPSGDLMTLLKRGLEAYERELQKERFAVGRKPRGSARAKKSSSARAGAVSPPGQRGANSAVASTTSVDPRAVEPTSQQDPPPSAKRTRAWRCPAAIAREVFLRDAGQCSFVAPDGRRCCARRWLELDHVVPRARGGEDSTSNLRLRCRAHNQHYARQCFGAVRMRAAVRRARKRRARECAARVKKARASRER